MMGIVTLITLNILLWSEPCTPEAVNPPVDTGLPFPVGNAVTFTAEQYGLILGDYTPIMISECIRVVSMVAI